MLWRVRTRVTRLETRILGLRLQSNIAVRIRKCIPVRDAPSQGVCLPRRDRVVGVGAIGASFKELSRQVAIRPASGKVLGSRDTRSIATDSAAATEVAATVTIFSVTGLSCATASSAGSRC